MVRAKPMTTHCTLGNSMRRSSAMEGSATMTLPWSTTEAKSPIANAPKTRYLLPFWFTIARALNDPGAALARRQYPDLPYSHYT